MQQKQISNKAINQIFLILLILLIGYSIFKYLLYYLPGFLGAITLYMLFRKMFIKLTAERKLNKSLVSISMIFLAIVFIVLPTWALVNYLVPQATELFQNKDLIMSKYNAVQAYMHKTPILKEIDLSNEALMNFLQELAKYVPSLLNSVAEVLINLVVAFFVLYFMQVNNEKLERSIYGFIPFSEKSKTEIFDEINMMVRSNAIGIPILGLCQGIVAVIGYMIFGVDNPILWGLITGLASIIPVVGTMAVWVPICVVVLATGTVGNGIGLALYCLILVGSIDNVLRFTILKKLGDVHPLITVFGVLLGLNMFGVLGLIFGPLILSSIFVLFKVYNNEFGKSKIILPSDDKLDDQ
ncbi:AI-2E family transporter [Sphingobacteriaceae bacterium WQ 2009]|uniref:AI-2E family transporter n=1 Tax=Rhinopithecimicrobium faecis TaxID=2820698 RepID=A0A8T4HAG5_9SPHI|nr:AI-2E family transporter [Sphingobacteriaceae bacterium WQ 2009]